ncbi:putative cytochrome P450 [Rosellinia necatrix]|uniref:Putative cytochrome P450 n=1 Tax=Rosellinia necatrix TaxID=77044 RepID=A0A1S8A9A4_ROSNE|nr:putative cytochrome P450 [Rosellinia necatrix]
MEAMCLSPAIATRSARIAQDKDLVYANWRVPDGTPVGMTIHLLLQNEQQYPEPKLFNPDRQMDPNHVSWAIDRCALWERKAQLS